MKKYVNVLIQIKYLDTKNVLYTSTFDKEGLFGEDLYF